MKIPRPESWSTICVCLLNKVKLPTDMTQNRPICLMSILYKVFIKSIWMIAEPCLDTMPEYQFSQPGAQTLEIPFILKLIQQKASNHCFTYIFGRHDLTRAFDSIHHGAVMAFLDAQKKLDEGVRLQLLTQLSDIILMPSLAGHKTKIHQKRGMKQGSPESSRIFSQTVAWHLLSLKRSFDERGYGFEVAPGRRVNILLFADDIFLLPKMKMNTNKWQWKYNLHWQKLASTCTQINAHG